MRRFVYFFFLTLIAGVSFWQWQRVISLKSQVSEQRTRIENFNALERARAQPDVTFDYGEYQKHPVQLILETDGVVLQVVHQQNEFEWKLGDDDLGYLKTQIETLIAEKNGIRLQDGRKLRLEGYPTWGPHYRLDPDSQRDGAKRLYFGESATFDGETIVVHGTPNKPVGYYPYHICYPSS